MSTLNRAGSPILLIIVALALSACSGTPTEPSPVPPPPPGSLTGEAVIDGRIVEGGGSATAESISFSAAAFDPQNVRVTVGGTTIADTTDAQGRFRLVNAPEGNLQLHFSRTDINAQLTLSDVGTTQHVEIQVQVQGSTAQLVEQTRHQLEKFNETIVAVTAGPLVGEGTIQLERTGNVTVDSSTAWDPNGDYYDIVALETAVNGGILVKAKGQGTRDSTTGVLLVSMIRAKIQVEEGEFEGPVASASGTDPNGTIMLVSNDKGPILRVDTDAATAWDLAGDITNLTDLIDAVNAGMLVEVEGDGTVDPTGTFILAANIKAEVEVAQFDGPVASATGSHPNGTIMLVSNSQGPALQVDTDGSTVWDPTGDITDLDQLILELGAGRAVRVVGDGALNAAGTVILAANIRAELVPAAFDGPVASATGSHPNGTIMLVSNSQGPALQVDTDGSTVWDPTGDITDLDQLILELGAGRAVRVVGDGTLNAAGTVILAANIRAELVPAAFDGPVASASGSHPNGTIMLVSNSQGPALQVDTDGSTVWDPTGDITDLDQLITELGLGTAIDVEGGGFLDVTGTVIFAVTIRAEIDSGGGGGGNFGPQIIAIQNLINDVLAVAANNNLNRGNTNALVSKLDNAIKSLQKGNANAAIGQLNSFINQVNAFVRTGRITPAEGQDLVQKAQVIIADIQAAS